MISGGGAPQEFDAFVRATFTLYFRKALFDTRTRQDAEDVVQETYLKIWARWPLERVQHPRGYGYKVLKNTIATHFREQSRAQRPGPGETPEVVEIRARHTPSAVRASLDKLPSAEREIIWLRYFEELSFTEIAELLSLQRKTVHNYHSKARAALRASLSRLIVVGEGGDDERREGRHG